MATPIISLRSVVATVDQFPLLAGVNLQIEDAEVVLLRGSNGAGKTSLLRLLAGLIPLAQGDASVLGYDLRTERKALRKFVGLAGHDPFLYDDLTVVENVRLFVELSAADVSNCGEAISRFGLDGRLADVRVAKLSQGQRRRVALAILYARRPLVWLLDEPHAGLDQSTRDELNLVIEEAVIGGAAVIYSSHEAQPMAFAQRIVHLEGGHIVEYVDVA